MYCTLIDQLSILKYTIILITHSVFLFKNIFLHAFFARNTESTLFMKREILISMPSINYYAGIYPLVSKALPCQITAESRPMRDDS